jgi:hypothetical protein
MKETEDLVIFERHQCSQIAVCGWNDKAE